MEKVIAWTYLSAKGRPAYVSDLPGCDGAVNNPATPNSDWGYSSKEAQALRLTSAQWKKFAKCQRDCGRAAFCAPA